MKSTSSSEAFELKTSRRLQREMAGENEERDLTRSDKDEEQERQR